MDKISIIHNYTHQKPALFSIKDPLFSKFRKEVSLAKDITRIKYLKKEFNFIVCKISYWGESYNDILGELKSLIVIVSESPDTISKEKELLSSVKYLLLHDDIFYHKVVLTALSCFLLSIRDPIYFVEGLIYELSLTVYQYQSHNFVIDNIDQIIVDINQTVCELTESINKDNKANGICHSKNTEFIRLNKEEKERKTFELKKANRVKMLSKSRTNTSSLKAFVNAHYNMQKELTESQLKMYYQILFNYYSIEFLAISDDKNAEMVFDEIRQILEKIINNEMPKAAFFRTISKLNTTTVLEKKIVCFQMTIFEAYITLKASFKLSNHLFDFANNDLKEAQKIEKRELETIKTLRLK